MRLPSGSVISVGLAAVFAGLLALVRRRWRQRRIPGDPPGADLALPHLPAAAEAAERAWLAAHRRVHDQYEDDDLDADGHEERDRTAGSLADTNGLIAPAADTASAGTDGVAGRGVTVGGLPAPSLLALAGPAQARALADRAWVGGVGLTGPGAAGAARAVLARLLTGAGPIGGQLVTTDAAVAALLPAEAAEGFAVVPGVRVFPTLAGALTACEAELLGRSRRLADADAADLAGYRRLPDAEPVAALLLLADSPDNPLLAARAEAVLRLGPPDPRARRCSCATPRAGTTPGASPCASTAGSRSTRAT